MDEFRYVLTCNFLNTTSLYNALTFLRADCLILTVYNLDPLQRLFPPISGSRQNSLASNWLPSDPMSDFVETLSHVQPRSQGCFVDEEPYSRILSKTRGQKLSWVCKCLFIHNINLSILSTIFVWPIWCDFTWLQFNLYQSYFILITLVFTSKYCTSNALQNISL